MKTLRQFLFLCFLAVLAGCSEDAFVPQSEVSPIADGNSVELISMVVPDIEMGDATTRSRLYEDGNEMKFAWQENDAIGVVPLSGWPLGFPIHAENAGKNTAVFDGGDWALKADGKYAAFFPLDGSNQRTDITRIAFSYAGQTESNYAKYDFLATGAVQPNNGQVTFNMKRLSAILKIRITMPTNTVGQHGALVAQNPVFGVSGTMDLSGTEPVINANYSKIIWTKLNEEYGSYSSWTYEVIMMIPAVDLSSESLKFRITSDQGFAYEAPLTGKNFEAGKAYVLEGVASPAYIENENLIAAAKSTSYNPGVTFQLEDGKLKVNANIDNIAKVKTLYLYNRKDPTVCDEISYFSNLEELYCEKNNLTSLDVSMLTNLKLLLCGENQLTSLDLSNNPALTEVSCYNNLLHSLDLSNNPALTSLYCYNNSLKSLDLSNNRKVTEIRCHNNVLTSLDVSNNSLLTGLYCGDNQLTSLDVSFNHALSVLNCSQNKLTSLDVSKNTVLKQVICNDNELTSLDLSKNYNLLSVICYMNYLTTLDVSYNSLLESIYCYGNLMSTLNITSNTSLTKSRIMCGGQYTNSTRTEMKTLTLTARAADTTSLMAINNSNVEIESQ